MSLNTDNNFDFAERMIAEICEIDENNPEMIRLEAALKRSRFIYEKNH